MSLMIYINIAVTQALHNTLDTQIITLPKEREL